MKNSNFDLKKYPTKKYYKGPKKGKLSGNPLGKNPSDIWNIPNVKSNHVEKTEHPCQFPVELIERLVLSLTNEKDWVFDPFMGVASTAIASLLHNRKAIGAEIIEGYVNIGWERIDQAEKGELRIRPMNRPVYDPKEPQDYLPPRIVNLQSQITDQQPKLFENNKNSYNEGTEQTNENNI